MKHSCRSLMHHLILLLVVCALALFVTVNSGLTATITEANTSIDAVPRTDGLMRGAPNVPAGSQSNLLPAVLPPTMPLPTDDWNQKFPSTKPSARFFHAMANIGSGEALLFGGETPSLNDETWVYDLGDNTWTLKTPATNPSARINHAMASIGGDQVLLFGGYAGGSTNDDETWVYDLSDNTWTQKFPSAKPSARAGHRMASIGGDRVLLFGGQDSAGFNSDETWVYDLSDNTWTQKFPSTTPSGRNDHAMASIGGDQVLLFGGFPFNDETWVYDLSDNSWTLKSPATKPSSRETMAMADIGSDQVLLFGGVDAVGRQDDTWVYDLSDDTWTLKSPATKPPARDVHAMAYLGGDQVLLFGGFDGSLFDDNWVYDLSDNTWTQKFPSTKPSARNDHAMASLGGDKVLLFGGFPFNDETWVYDLSDNKWTLKSPAIKPSSRETTAMAYIGGDQVLLFGGVDAVGRQDDTWVYDLSDNTWTLKSPTTKPSARDVHAMAYMGGDQVLLFGGFDGSLFDDTWVYDLSDNTWTQKFPSTKPSARFFHAMANIGGDEVLLFGGETPSLNDETWLYDLSDNAWTLKTPATKPSARINHAMASIGGDQVLSFGGYAGGSSNDDETWVYDLSDNTWTLKSPTTKPSARAGHRMASIGGGQVLLFGGQDSAGFNSDETWLYAAGQPPTISGATISLQQGVATSNSIIATVNDAQDPAGSLTVTATSVPAGISVTNIINTDGTITANVAASCTAPLGDNTVELTVTDSGSLTATANLIVTVTPSNPPVITLKPSIALSPPNHSYHTVTVAQMIASASDDCDGNLFSGVIIEKVTSDEPDNAPGTSDGNTSNDIVIAGDCKSVQLRSERDDTKNGRVYGVTLRVSDASGNITRAAFKVTVPKGNVAVQGATAFTVTSSCP